MADEPRRSRKSAETAFRKVQKAARDQDKSEAMLQYESDIEAVRKKSARLRGLRLAREAAEAESAAAGASGGKKKRRPKH